MSSNSTSKNLNFKLNELSSSTENVERLAIQVKTDHDKLFKLANSTISYITQLKSDFKKKKLI